MAVERLKAMTKRLFRGLMGAGLGLVSGAFWGLVGTAALMAFLGLLAVAIAALFGFLPALNPHMAPSTLGMYALWVLKIGVVIGVVVGPWLGFASGFEKDASEKSYYDYVKPIWPFYLFRRRSANGEA
ncbi:MAG: hypothetical protein WDM91_08670 [Rhizomicrobium sp.]